MPTWYALRVLSQEVEMTVTVTEREEWSFLDYILELARKEMASSAGRSEDEATEVRPVSGAPRERIAR